jgi:hypothetical protein
MNCSEHRPFCNAASTEQDAKLVFTRPDEGRLQAVAHETVPAEFDACNETHPTGILFILTVGISPMKQLHQPLLDDLGAIAARSDEIAFVAVRE